MKYLLFILVFGLWVSLCPAAVIHVPGDQVTIQAGINAANSGDTVLVAEGSYPERIRFGSTAITLASEYLIDGDSLHISATIIDGDTALTSLNSDTGSVVFFPYSTDSSTSLIGFTVTNGVGSFGRDGGGLYIHGSPKIRNCVVSNNSANRGAGIYVYGSAPSIDGCVIADNIGDGISCRETSMGTIVTNSIIAGNSANGLELLSVSSCVVGNSQFLNNGGIGVYNGADPGKTGTNKSFGLEMQDCLIEGNAGRGVKVCDVVGTLLLRCEIRDNADGGIFQCNYEAGFYFVMDSCIIEGNTSELGGALYSWSANFGSISNCLFLNNTALQGGAILLSGSKSFEKTGGAISNCTFVGNNADVGSALNFLWSYDPGLASITNSIIAFNGPGEAVYSPGDSGTVPEFLCTDIFGNEGGDWTGPIADQLGTNNNISIDPLFCDTANNDFHIYDVSPCTPDNNSCDALIGALGVGCNVAVITDLIILDEASFLNIIDHTPTFSWTYSATGPFVQNNFEIAVDTNNDWQDSGVWNPTPFESADTFVTYDGDSLIDGETYYLRLRIGDDGVLSDWYETSFRMNSIPSVPVLLSPAGGEVDDSQPILTLLNSVDADNDSVFYIYEIASDKDFTEIVTTSSTISQQPDSTSWQSDIELTENEKYYWRARATDTYQDSEWPEPESFYVNAANMPPSEFSLIMPPDTSGLPVAALRPTFVWSPSSDPDPLDIVHYILMVAEDSLFTNPIINDSAIFATSYDAQEDLPRNTAYWWKVMAVDQDGAVTRSLNLLSFRTMLCGDANNDGSVSVTDAVYVINYIFVGGAPPQPYAMGDVNCDQSVNISDAVLIINYIFVSGKPPCDLDADMVPDC